MDKIKLNFSDIYSGSEYTLNILNSAEIPNNTIEEVYREGYMKALEHLREFGHQMNVPNVIPVLRQCELLRLCDDLEKRYQIEEYRKQIKHDVSDMINVVESLSE